MYLINWRRGRGSNPRYVSVYTLSRRAPSTARPPLQNLKLRVRTPPCGRGLLGPSMGLVPAGSPAATKIAPGDFVEPSIRFRIHTLPGVRLQPLGHLSIKRQQKHPNLDVPLSRIGELKPEPAVAQFTTVQCVGARPSWPLFDSGLEARVQTPSLDRSSCTATAFGISFTVHAAQSRSELAFHATNPAPAFTWQHASG